MPMISRELAQRIVRFYPLIKAFAEGKDIQYPFKNYRGELIQWETVDKKFHLEYVDAEWKVIQPQPSIILPDENVVLTTESGFKICVPIGSIIPILNNEKSEPPKGERS